MAEYSTIFQPLEPGHPVATLFLIENSQEMVSYWPELRNHYLPTLLGTMRLANPVVPIQVLWLPSSPASTSEDKSRIGQIQYNELPELGFNYDPNNKITPSTVQRAIHSLSTTFEGIPATRHLFVIAASDPTAASDEEEAANMRLVWMLLAEQLVRANIYLHMILRSNQNVQTLTELYYRTLRIQGNEEVSPWFKVDDQKCQFLLSAQPRFPLQAGVSPFSYQSETADYALPTPISPLSDPGTSDPRSTPPHILQRSQTFPPPIYATEDASAVTAADTTPDDVSPKPNLVTRLKKIHGMTKRRTYGSHTSVRQPFVRSDSGSGSGSGATPSSRGSIPYHKSAAARAHYFNDIEAPAPRVGLRHRSKAQTSVDPKAGPMPTNCYGNEFLSGSHIPLTSPISDSSTSSPASAPCLEPSSPLASDLQMLPSDVPAPSSSHNRIALDNSMTESVAATSSSYLPQSASTWAHGQIPHHSPSQAAEQVGYFSSGTDQRQEWISNATMHHAPMSEVGAAPMNTNQIPYHADGSLMSDEEIIGNQAPAETAYPMTPPLVSRPSDGDQPFIFNPEFEAQIAARFEETILAAGIAPPVLPLQRMPHPDRSLQLAPAGRSSLFVSTSASPSRSNYSSLQPSPLPPLQGLHTQSGLSDNRSEYPRQMPSYATYT